MSKNVITNHNLDEYIKKYRNNKYKLLKFSKKEIESFDKLFSPKHKNYLLNNKNWWLIGDTYYEIPKAPRWTWFRNLNNACQVGTLVVLGGIIATAVSLPIALQPKPSEFQKDIDKVVAINNEIKDRTFTTCLDFVQTIKERTTIDITTEHTIDDRLEYVFSQEDNKLAIAKKDDLSFVYPSKTPAKSNIWRFVSTITDNAEYSQYVKDDFVSLETSVELKAGFDAGYNDTINYIEYNNKVADNNIIRTNVGTVVINAPKDTVKHYGYADKVVINAIAANSYHEYGTVGSLSIASGRIVLEKEADLPESINIINPSDGSKVEEGSTVNIEVKNEDITSTEFVKVIHKEEDVEAKIKDININGDEKVSEEVKKEIEEKKASIKSVSTQQEIIDSIVAENINEVILKDNIDVTIEVGKGYIAGININKDFTLEGNGYSLNCEDINNVGTEDMRHRHVLGINAENAEVTVSNLTINMNGSKNIAGYYDSIRVNNAYNSTLNFNNVNIVQDGFYAFYIYNNNEQVEGKTLDETGIEINIDSCNFSSFGAIIARANNINLNVSNSVLTGENKDLTEFSVVQIQYPIYNEILNCNNTFKFNNTIFNAIFDPESAAIETAITVLSPLNNKIIVSDCTFNCNPASLDYQFIEIPTDDKADLIDNDIKTHCAAMKDSSYSSITDRNGLFAKCPVTDKIIVDGVNYGYASGYTKDNRFKVGLIDESGNFVFDEYK